MRVQFSFEWGTKLTDEERHALPDVLGKPLEMESAEERSDQPKSYVTYEADLARLLEVIRPEVSVNIAGLADPRPLMDIADGIDAMRRRLDAVSTKPETYVNTLVDVHVPGAALLAIDDLQLQEDCCTDRLQSLLNEGWRIVAVCPQPDQRRPDYILGRRVGTDLTHL